MRAVFNLRDSFCLAQNVLFYIFPQNESNFVTNTLYKVFCENIGGETSDIVSKKTTFIMSRPLFRGLSSCFVFYDYLQRGRAKYSTMFINKRCSYCAIKFFQNFEKRNAKMMIIGVIPVIGYMRSSYFFCPKKGRQPMS